MRKLWYGVAIASTIINFGGAIYAVMMGEPMHGYVHGALLVGSIFWLRYLRNTRPVDEYVIEESKARMLADDLDVLQRELMETQQKLDFADQLLKNQQKKTEE